MIIGLSTAIGPSFYGVLFDLSGSYRLPMLMAALLNCAATAIIVAGQRHVVGSTSGLKAPLL